MHMIFWKIQIVLLFLICLIPTIQVGWIMKWSYMKNKLVFANKNLSPGAFFCILILISGLSWPLTWQLNYYKWLILHMSMDLPFPHVTKASFKFTDM